MIDIEMVEASKAGSQKAEMMKEVVCGAPALNFKRDHMKIESLYLD
jgi:hypothetical protein